jgi:hypothetical protein
MYRLFPTIKRTTCLGPGQLDVVSPCFSLVFLTNNTLATGRARPAPSIYDFSTEAVPIHTSIVARSPFALRAINVATSRNS